jgi:hypothetical protein
MKKLKSYLQYLLTFRKADLFAAIFWTIFVVFPWTLIGHLAYKSKLARKDLVELADWQNPEVWMAILTVVSFWAVVVWVSWRKKDKGESENPKA